MGASKIFLLGLVLIAVVAPDAATGRHVKGHNIPNSAVGAAYIFSGQQSGKKADAVLAENTLRSFALLYSDHAVDANLAWVRQSDWQPQFKALFEGAVRWARTIRQRRPEELYRLSREYRARPDARDRNFVSVANMLRRLAARGGHEQARQEDDEWLRNYERERSPTDSPEVAIRAAEGDSSAMFLLATRYQDGEGVKKSLAKSYYWFLRAREGGGDAAIKIWALEAIASTAEKDLALKWFRDGTAPGL